MENSNNLVSKHCMPCEVGTPPLSREMIADFLAALPGWELVDGGISRKFEFRNYYQTMAFVNAVAWIAHSENHHPDMEVSYRSCLIHYRTHAINGLSENDFICATKVNALLMPA